MMNLTKVKQTNYNGIIDFIKQNPQHEKEFREMTNWKDDIDDYDFEDGISDSEFIEEILNKQPKEYIVTYLDNWEVIQVIEVLDLAKYEEAYCILMAYWDSLPDEEKPKIDKQLKELGL